MNAEKAGTDDIEVLVKMRLNYLLEDNGSLRLCDQGWTKHRFMRFLSDR